MVPLGFSFYGIMSSTNSDSYIQLLWLGLPKLCWIKVVRGHPCLAPDLRGNAFSFSLLRMVLVVGLSYMAFIMLREVLCPLSGVYHKWMLNCMQEFSQPIVDDHMVFIFQFVNVVYYTHWFVDIEKSLYPWDKYRLIMVSEPFNTLLE